MVEIQRLEKQKVARYTGRGYFKSKRTKTFQNFKEYSDIRSRSNNVDIKI